jgi:hypothetical protein
MDAEGPGAPQCGADKSRPHAPTSADSALSALGLFRVMIACVPQSSTRTGGCWPGLEGGAAAEEASVASLACPVGQAGATHAASRG